MQEHRSAGDAEPCLLQGPGGPALKAGPFCVCDGSRLVIQSETYDRPSDFPAALRAFGPRPLVVATTPPMVCPLEAA
jgi:hypothetical protein